MTSNPYLEGHILLLRGTKIPAHMTMANVQCPFSAHFGHLGIFGADIDLSLENV
jgi:hypothetical protein